MSRSVTDIFSFVVVLLGSVSGIHGLTGWWWERVGVERKSSSFKYLDRINFCRYKIFIQNETFVIIISNEFLPYSDYYRNILVKLKISLYLNLTNFQIILKQVLEYIQTNK